jgi:hypothetical protein
MLSVLHEQLGEAHGLAMAASETVDRVESRLDDPELRRRLDELRLDAAEVRGRCLEAERAYGEEHAAEILAHANTIAERAADVANAWFKAGTGPFAAWSFLAMGEAGELSSWTALCALEESELACWGVEVQRRHLELVLSAVPLVAALFAPGAPRRG